MSAADRVPGWGIAQGIGVRLRASSSSPRSRSSTPRAQDISPQHRGRLHPALRRGRQRSSARPASSAPRPARSRSSTWAASTPRPLPRPLGPGRAVRRAARGVGPAPLRPAGARPHASTPWRHRPGAARRASWPPRTTSRAGCCASSSRRRTAYGHLPVAALQHIEPPDRRLVQRDLRHRHLATRTCASSRRPATSCAVCRCPQCTLLGGGRVLRRLPRASRHGRRRRDPRRRGAPRDDRLRRRQRRRAAGHGGRPVAAGRRAPRMPPTIAAALRATAEPGPARHEPDHPARRTGMAHGPARAAGATTRRGRLAAAEKAGAWAAWQKRRREPDARGGHQHRQRGRPARPRRRRLPDRRQVARRAPPVDAEPALRRRQRLRGRPRRAGRPDAHGARPARRPRGRRARRLRGRRATSAFIAVRASAATRRGAPARARSRTAEEAGYIGTRRARRRLRHPRRGARRSRAASSSARRPTLLRAIENKRAQPDQRPPYPVAVGPVGPADRGQQRRDAGRRAVDRGQRRRRLRRASATPRRPGTTLVQVSGAVRKPGIAEVPLGMSLRELLDGSRRFVHGKLKAVLVGGPTAASCRPPSSTRRYTPDGADARRAPSGLGHDRGRRRDRPASSTWPRC